VCALGIRTNNELARAAGLEIDGSNDGVIVNQELEARRDVFVAGDVCSYYDVALGRRRVEHQDHAEFSGMRAGANMTGDRTPYTYQSLCWSSLGDIRWEACGIVDPTLENVSVWQTRVRYCMSRVLSLLAVGLFSDTEVVYVAQRPDGGDSGAVPDAPSILSADPYHRGVVYYLRAGKIVGVVLWNVRDRGDAARALLQAGRSYASREEIAALISL
jgi:programmed cell death 8 (apoptosis-inducing factor)